MNHFTIIESTIWILHKISPEEYKEKKNVAPQKKSFVIDERDEPTHWLWKKKNAIIVPKKGEGLLLTQHYTTDILKAMRDQDKTLKTWY